MRLRRLLAGCALASVTALVPPQALPQDLFAGVCTVNLTMSFGSAISRDPLAPSTTATLSGGGSCTLPDGTSTITRTITITTTSGPAAGNVTTCEAIVVKGGYTAIFSGGSPAPQTSDGMWVFAGNLAGGELALIDMITPAFVGSASLVINPVTGVNVPPTPHPSLTPTVVNCATGGSISSLALTGVLAFADP